MRSSVFAFFGGDFNNWTIVAFDGSRIPIEMFGFCVGVRMGSRCVISHRHLEIAHDHNLVLYCNVYERFFSYLP